MNHRADRYVDAHTVDGGLVYEDGHCPVCDVEQTLLGSPLGAVVVSSKAWKSDGAVIVELAAYPNLADVVATFVFVPTSRMVSQNPEQLLLERIPFVLLEKYLPVSDLVYKRVDLELEGDTDD